MSDITKIKETFAQATEEMKGLIETQNVELKELGTTTDNTSKKMNDVTSLLESVNAELINAQGRMDEFEAQTKRHGATGAPAHKSLGDLVTNSSQYKSMMDAPGRSSTDGIPVGSFDPYIRNAFGMSQKALSSAAASAGDAAFPERVSEIMGDPLYPQRLRDLMVVNPTASGSVEFVQETLHNPIKTTVSAVTTAQENLKFTLTNPNGFYVGQTITIGAAGSVRGSGVIKSITSGLVELVAGMDNNAEVDDAVYAEYHGGTDELGLKPEAEFTFDLITKSVRTLAHWLPSSRQILDDAPGLASYINTRLMESLILSEERQILYGNDGAGELDGILKNSGIQTLTGASEAKLYQVRKAMTKVSLSHFPVDAIVVHPTDWQDIELAQDDDKRLIWSQVPNGGEMRLWKAPVVVSSAIDAGTALVGSFRMGTALWDREQSQVRISEHHSDFFAKNMVAVLAEERLAQTIYRPSAFCKLTFG